MPAETKEPKKKEFKVIFVPFTDERPFEMQIFNNTKV